MKCITMTPLEFGVMDFHNPYMELYQDDTTIDYTLGVQGFNEVP